MQFYSVERLLTEAGFQAPELCVLRPNHENYSALLLQPQGEVEADSDGVRNVDAALAHKQHAAFLTNATTNQVELAITPEYSTPWSVIEEALNNGATPPEGALWVIGCESTTVEQLDLFKERVSGRATVLHERLTPAPGRFLDPVLYIFQARSVSGDAVSRPLVIAQFKTSPMADDGHFEINGLHTGSRIYFFGNGTTQLRLATLICSDALVFMDDDATEIYDRTLLIHIQLNPKPRQSQFRQYRSRLMQFDGDQTEVICLNWAHNVHFTCDRTRKCWDNISGTAWYLRPSKFDNRDIVLAASHRNGLYYTWLTDLRCHALFFNYSPGVFLVLATKAAHIGVPASLSRRRGPQLRAASTWSDTAMQWEDIGLIDDGFSSIVHESGDAKGDLESLAATNPFAVERALALAAGSIPTYEWHELKALDSCTITLSEVVNRVTACQDTDASAVQFRTGRLRTAHRIVSLLKTSPPPALNDLKAGFSLSWSDHSPHTNIVSPDGKRATAIYLGDEHSMETIEEIAARAADHIGQWETEADAIVTGKQRLTVWYRDRDGQDVAFGTDRYVGFSQTHTESPFDIGREE